MDIESVQEMVRLSRHELAGFLLLIVGTLPAPAGLFISIIRSNSFEELDVISSDVEQGPPTRSSRIWTADRRL